MRRAWIAVLALLCAAGLAFAEGAPEKVAAPPQPAVMAAPAALPEGVLALIEIRSLDDLQTHLEEYAAAITPESHMPPLLATGLAKLARSSDPAVMDSAQPMRILFLKAPEGQVSLVFQFFVKDPAAYERSLPPDLKKGEEKDGVTAFFREQRQFDSGAFKRATPEEQKDKQKFWTTTQKSIGVAFAAPAVCIGDDLPAVGQALALVRGGTLGPKPVLEAGDAAASVEVTGLMGHLNLRPGGALSDLKKSIAQSLSRIPIGPGMQEVFAAELDAAESCLKQVDRASARFTADARDIRLSFELAPMKGLALAAYLSSVKPGVPETVKYFPDEAVGVMAVKLGDLDPLADPLIAFTRKLLVASGATPADIEKVAALAGQAFRAVGDEYSFALLPGKGLHEVLAFRLKDPEVFKQLLAQAPGMINAMLSLYRKMGIEMTASQTTVPYAGRDIADWKFSMEVKPPEGATPQEKSALADRQKAMETMFGGNGLTSDVAVLDKDCVQTIGSGSLDLLKTILDGKQKSFADAEEFKSLRDSLPPNAVGVGLLHLTALAEWQLAQMRAMSGGNTSFPEPKFQRGPGAAAVFTIAPAGESVGCEIRVPAAEPKAIVDGMKAAMAPPQQPPPARPATQPKPAPAAKPAPTPAPAK